MKIGIIAPASPVEKSNLDAALCWFSKNGHSVKFSKNLFKSDRFMAGSDNDRADDLHDMFMDDEIDFIFCARGGYGSGRILDLIDYDMIKKHKKGFMGLSDITALQLAMYQKSELCSYTGIVIKNDFENPFSSRLDTSLKSAINGEKQRYTNLTTFNSGIAKGVVIGGNLTMITTLLGTPYQPDFKDKILFIEEVGEEPFRVDRMLNHLRLAGIFNNIRGLIIGNFTVSSSKDKNDGTLAEVFDEQFKKLPIPIITNFLNGHIKDKYLLKIGANITMNANNGEIYEI